MEQYAEKQDFAGVIKFETRTVEDKEASAKAGHAVQKEEDWITVHTKGGIETTEHKVALVKKGKAKLWGVIEEHYTAWKDGHEIPEDGTPLVGWSGATRAQVETLANYHIKTVEDLSEIPDGNLKDLPMGFSRMRTMARDYLGEVQSTGKMAQDLAALRDTNDALQSTIDNMQMQMDDMTKAMQTLQEPKRGPGRPKKAA